MTTPPSAGPCDRGDLHHDRVERDRVRQVLARDEVGHERLPRGQIERAGGGAARRQHVDRPQAREAPERHRGQDDGEAGHDRLRDEHQAPPVERVGRDAAEEREPDDRHDADEPDQAERERAVIVGGEQRDVPQNRGRLHEVAGERNEEPEPEQAEVPMLERGEHGDHSIMPRWPARTRGVLFGRRGCGYSVGERKDQREDQRAERRRDKKRARPNARTQAALSGRRRRRAGEGRALPLPQRTWRSREHLPRHPRGRSRQSGGAHHAAAGAHRSVRRRQTRTSGRARSSPCSKANTTRRTTPGSSRSGAPRRSSRAAAPARASARTTGLSKRCATSNAPSWLRPSGNDDARLRWNACARFLDRHPHLRPAAEDGARSRCSSKQWQPSH